MYDAEYFHVESKEAFNIALATPKQSDLRIIEVTTDRRENVLSHRNLWTDIIKELDEQWNS